MTAARHKPKPQKQKRKKKESEVEEKGNQMQNAPSCKEVDADAGTEPGKREENGQYRCIAAKVEGQRCRSRMRTRASYVHYSAHPSGAPSNGEGRQRGDVAQPRMRTPSSKRVDVASRRTTRGRDMARPEGRKQAAARSDPARQDNGGPSRVDLATRQRQRKYDSPPPLPFLRTSTCRGDPTRAAGVNVPTHASLFPSKPKQKEKRRRRTMTPTGYGAYARCGAGPGYFGVFGGGGCTAWGCWCWRAVVFMGRVRLRMRPTPSRWLCGIERRVRESVGDIGKGRAGGLGCAVRSEGWNCGQAGRRPALVAGGDQPDTINHQRLPSYLLKVIQNRRSPVVLVGLEDGSKPALTVGLQ
ncbi:hypothetical protein B0H14DRAFT_2595338 [Mycena olivaceomarginata]|nr:hypothetical protein B0H14DRAFT_2595338 [Mycena olivaceomarginata]